MAKFLTPKWDASLSPAANARRQLPRLAAEYFAFGNHLLAEAKTPAALHELRLATKRFRYTLELMRDLHGPALTSRLRSLQRAQQLLGAANDNVAAAALLGPRHPARARLHREAERLAAEFRCWWRDEFAPCESAWLRYLARGARDLTPAATSATGSGKPARPPRPSPAK